MKKLMTLALVALSAAALQAVTYMWTGSNNNSATVSQLDSTTLEAAKTTRQSVSYIGSDTDTTSFPTMHAQAYVVAILFDGSAAGDIVRYTSNSSSYLSMGFSTSGLVSAGNSNSTATYADGVTSATVSNLITSGSNTLITQIVVTPMAQDGNTLTTITYYLNGELIGTTSRSGGYNVDFVLFNSDVFDVFSIDTNTDYADTDSYTEAQVAEMTNALTTAAANATDILTTNLVPEPTCLALLALGVAGLALRRKA